MPLTQTSGLLEEEILPGMHADSGPSEKRTGYSPDADKDATLKGIPFGRGLFLSDNAPDGSEQKYNRLPCRLPAAADTQFLGIAFRTYAVEGFLGGPPTADNDGSPYGYGHNEPFAYWTNGRIGVEVVGDVALGDSVFCIHTAGDDHGKFSADGTNGIEITDAHWTGSGTTGDVVALNIKLD